MIPVGKKQNTAFVCKVCGKEGQATNIRNHIEANHLEGISIPCDCCDKVFSGRGTLWKHKTKFHNYIKGILEKSPYPQEKCSKMAIPDYWTIESESLQLK